MTVEILVALTRFDGLLEVSSLGRVRTVAREMTTRFLSPDEKLLVITDRATGMTIAQLAEKHGVSRSQIHNLVRKK